MIASPGNLNKFDLIRLPYTYPGEQPERKRFVFICNEGGHAICLKTTTKVTLYQNDPALMAGVVFYPEGIPSLFQSPTAIQPDNLHPIAHSDILKSVADRTFEHLGVMPTAFLAALNVAVAASKTMKPERKRSLLSRL